MNKMGIRSRLMIMVTTTVAVVVLLLSIVACYVAVTNHNDQKKQTVFVSLDSCKNIMEAWLGEKMAICDVMAM